MTRFLADDAGFAGWRYRRDATHVVFYKETTFRNIAGPEGSLLIVLPGLPLRLVRQRRALGGGVL